MNVITENVIKDLLPLYLDGEASDDTRRLVESFLADHPELRAQADAAARVRPPQADIPQQVDQALQTLERTKAALARQKWMQFFAVFFTMLPFSFSFSGGQITFWMMRHPWSLIPLWAGAAGFWFAYWKSRQPARP